MYARGNGKSRYQRAGSVESHPVTPVGKLNLKLHRVRDKEEEKIFLLVEDRIESDGKKIYQEDISVISAELATKMTYRDAVKEGKQFVKDFPSTCTINRRVKGERSFQLDLIHLLRDTSFKLCRMEK